MAKQKHKFLEHERLQQFKESLIHKFEEMPWPHSSQEEWRRSDISVFDFDSLGHGDSELLENTAPELKNSSFKSLNSILKNEELSSLNSQYIDEIFQKLELIRDSSPNKLVLWNLLNSEDYLLLRIPAKTQEEDLQEICWHSLGEDISRHITIIVYAEAQSSSNIIFRLRGLEGHAQNIFALYILKEESNVKMFTLQESSQEVLSFYQAQASLDNYAYFQHFEGILGAGYVKNRIEVDVCGRGSNLNLNGIYLANEDQHIDMRTIQHHIVDHAESRTFYKGAALDDAECIFQGLIEVNHEATGTDAYLTNNNLILSDSATVDSIPSLNINTNDVKCSHGSTTGKLNEEAIFYLQSRGLTKLEAREMLTLGFFEELIATLPNTGKEMLRTKIQKILNNGIDKNVPPS